MLIGMLARSFRLPPLYLTKRSIVDAERFAEPLHAVVDDLHLFALVRLVGKLIQVRSPRQEQHDVVRVLGEAFAQRLQVVGLHSAQVEHAIFEVSRSAPRWTPKDDRILGNGFEPLLHNIETVTLDKPDLLVDAVDFGVAFGAFELFWVFLDSKDTLPASAERKCDGVASRATERVDQYLLRRWCGLCNMLGDLPNAIINNGNTTILKPHHAYCATASDVTPNHELSVR